jgi:hypothetical protein
MECDATGFCASFRQIAARLHQDLKSGTMSTAMTAVNNTASVFDVAIGACRIIRYAADERS